MQKGFASVSTLVVLLVILASAGVYLYYSGFISKPAPLVLSKNVPKASIAPVLSLSPTSSESTNSADIADWKTYTNKSGRYLIKYPLNWALIHADNETASFSFGINNNAPFGYLDISYWNITDINSYKHCSLSSNELCIGTMGQQKEDILDTTLDSKKAKSFYLYGMTGGGTPFYLAYHIVQNVDEPRLELKMAVNGLVAGKRPGEMINVIDKELDKTFNQILSTFKFTDSNWEIYANNYYGFSFQYPPEYKIIGQKNVNSAPNTTSIYKKVDNKDTHALDLKIEDSSTYNKEYTSFDQFAEDIVLKKCNDDSTDITPTCDGIESKSILTNKYNVRFLNFRAYVVINKRIKRENKYVKEIALKPYYVVDMHNKNLPYKGMIFYQNGIDPMGYYKFAGDFIDEIFDTLKFKD